MYSYWNEFLLKKIELTVCIKMDLALNDLERLICHKIQPTNQPFLISPVPSPRFWGSFQAPQSQLVLPWPTYSTVFLVFCFFVVVFSGKDQVFIYIFRLLLFSFFGLLGRQHLSDGKSLLWLFLLLLLLLLLLFPIQLCFVMYSFLASLLHCIIKRFILFSVWRILPCLLLGRLAFVPDGVSINGRFEAERPPISAGPPSDGRDATSVPNV